MNRDLPERAGVWLTTVLPGSRLVRATWLTGGNDHANHAVTVIDKAGRERRFVLRRWVRPNWRDIDPDYTVEREQIALTLLERAGAHTPRVVAVDREGDVCDVPALLMTRLPGGPPPEALSDMDDVEDVAGQLADAAVRFQAVDANGAGIPGYQPYHDLAERRVPADAPHPGLWAQAMAVLADWTEPSANTFIHRDYHPYNVLWHGHRLSAVIDWSNASIGHSDVDTAHMRWNLAVSYGYEVAERFRLAVQARTGRRYERLWDVRVIVDLIEGDGALGPDLPKLGRTTSHGDSGTRMAVLERLLWVALA